MNTRHSGLVRDCLKTVDLLCQIAVTKTAISDTFSDDLESTVNLRDIINRFGDFCTVPLLRKVFVSRRFTIIAVGLLHKRSNLLSQQTTRDAVSLSGGKFRSGARTPQPLQKSYCACVCECVYVWLLLIHNFARAAPY